jgi:hypothetical protein
MGLVSLGDVAACLRGGATAWTHARVGQKREEGRQDGGVAASSLFDETNGQARASVCNVGG